MKPNYQDTINVAIICFDWFHPEEQMRGFEPSKT